MKEAIIVVGWQNDFKLHLEQDNDAELDKSSLEENCLILVREN